MRKTANSSRRGKRRTNRHGLWISFRPKEDDASEASEPSQPKTTPEEEEQQFQREVTITLALVAVAFIAAAILGSLFFYSGK